MALGLIVVMGAFIKVCAVHTPSSNPRKPKHRQLTLPRTLQRRRRQHQSGGQGGARSVPSRGGARSVPEGGSSSGGGGGRNKTTAAPNAAPVRKSSSESRLWQATDSPLKTTIFSLDFIKK